MSTSSAPGAEIAAAINTASAVTGVSRQYLLATAARESSFDISAEASTSSAAGLYQFLEGTWLDMMERHGDALGVAPDGQSSSRQALLDLRYDPNAAALMAGALAKDNAAVLEARLGRSASPGELYAAHVLGASGAVQLIKAVAQDPAQPAEAVFPKAAEANEGLFYAKGEAVSVQALYDRLTTLPDIPPSAAPTAGPSPQNWQPSLSVSRLSAGPITLHLSPLVIEALAMLDAPTSAKANAESRDDEKTGHNRSR